MKLKELFLDVANSPMPQRLCSRQVLHAVDTSLLTIQLERGKMVVNPKAKEMTSREDLLLTVNCTNSNLVTVFFRGRRVMTLC